MTNYEARKTLQFLLKQVKPDTEEYAALHHAIDVLDTTYDLLYAFKTLQEMSDEE